MANFEIQVIVDGKPFTARSLVLRDFIREFLTMKEFAFVGEMYRAYRALQSASSPRKVASYQAFRNEIYRMKKEGIISQVLPYTQPTRDPLTGRLKKSYYILNNPVPQ